MPLSSLALAHVGDGIYELLARTHVVRNGGNLARQMHKKTVTMVCAAAQARAARALEPMLEPAEREVFMRGRNSNPHSISKSASPQEYALATALEALFGWLYLTGQQQRVCQLFEEILALEPGEVRK